LGITCPRGGKPEKLASVKCTLVTVRKKKCKTGKRPRGGDGVHTPKARGPGEGCDLTEGLGNKYVLGGNDARKGSQTVYRTGAKAGLAEKLSGDSRGPGNKKQTRKRTGCD